MSRAILDAILNQMQVWLSEIDRGQLYNELLIHFGLIGAVDECRALEAAWRDPHTRHEMEGFIRAWLRRRGGSDYKHRLRAFSQSF